MQPTLFQSNVKLSSSPTPEWKDNYKREGTVLNTIQQEKSQGITRRQVKVKSRNHEGNRRDET